MFLMARIQTMTATRAREAEVELRTRKLRQAQVSSLLSANSSVGSISSDSLSLSSVKGEHGAAAGKKTTEGGVHHGEHGTAAYKKTTVTAGRR